MTELLELPLILFYVCIGTIGTLLLFLLALYVFIGLPSLLWERLTQ